MGRANCDIIVDSVFVSTVHARLTFVPGGQGARKGREKPGVMLECVGNQKTFFVAVSLHYSSMHCCDSSA